MYRSIKKLRTFNRINIWIVQVICVNFFAQIKIIKKQIETVIYKQSKQLNAIQNKINTRN